MSKMPAGLIFGLVGVTLMGGVGTIMIVESQAPAPVSSHHSVTEHAPTWEAPDITVAPCGQSIKYTRTDVCVGSDGNLYSTLTGKPTTL